MTFVPNPLPMEKSETTSNPIPKPLHTNRSRAITALSKQSANVKFCVQIS